MSPKNTNSTPNTSSPKLQTAVFITSTALASVLEGARRTHPDEFVAVLRGKRLKESEILELWGEGGGAKAGRAGAESTSFGKGRLKDVRAYRLSEVIVPPFAFNERDSSGFSDWYLPTDPAQIATFHSHPTVGVARPSNQDLLFFERHGPVHLIASKPYREQDVRAFDYQGKNVPLYGIP